jgi:hypothetical protein
MKIKTEGYYPFVVTAENKKSQAGNDYLSIGVGMSKKNQKGEYETTWFNMIDKRDLLMLASVCENAYHKIITEEAREHAGNKNNSPASVQSQSDAPAQTKIDDDIPF